MRRRPVSLGKQPSDKPTQGAPGVGVVVVAGAATTYALLTEKPAGSGDHFQPGQVSAGLVKS